MTCIVIGGVKKKRKPLLNAELQQFVNKNIILTFKKINYSDDNRFFLMISIVFKFLSISLNILKI